MAFLQDITLGQYYPSKSYLHSLDPRSKIMASLVLTTCLLFVQKLELVGVYLVISVLVWRLSSIPGQLILRNLRTFFWLVLITSVVHLFTSDGVSVLEVPVLDLTVTSAGIVKAVVYSTRILLLVALAGFLTLTTPPVEKLLRPLRIFRLPIHEFTLMITLSLRFIPILIQEAEHIKSAQLSRGLSLSGSILQRIKKLVPMIVPLFVSAIKRAEDLAVAMEARAYSGQSGRTTFRVLRFRWRDFVAFAFLVCVIFVTALVEF